MTNFNLITQKTIVVSSDELASAIETAKQNGERIIRVSEKIEA